MDMIGNWWLGDLGSAVEVGASVKSTTQWFSQSNLTEQPAKAEHDWYMLAVALVVEVYKTNWQERLFKDGHCSASKVAAAVLEVKTQSLLDLLQEILQRASVKMQGVFSQPALYWQAHATCMQIGSGRALTKHCKARQGQHPATVY